MLFFRNAARLGFFGLSRVPGLSGLLFRIGQAALARAGHFRPRSTSLERRVNRQSDAIDWSKPLEECEFLVRSGVGKGMRYPRRFAHGSVFDAKLCGSYESEIHPQIEAVFQRRAYRILVDIGCAEGYYAVGLARRFNQLRVFGFDTESAARDLMVELAAFNGVADRVFPCMRFSPHTFSVFPWEKRSLVICDCEGYEHQLFSSAIMEDIRQVDFLIELHRKEGNDIRQRLEQLFEKTHRSIFIPVIPAVEKFLQMRPTVPTEISNESLFRIVDEQRTASFGWLFLEANDE